MVKDVKQLKKQYKNEWLAIKIAKEKDWRVVKGELIAHSSDRRELHRKIQQKAIPKGLYITFTGPAIRPGYGFILIFFDAS